MTSLLSLLVTVAPSFLMQVAEQGVVIGAVRGLAPTVEHRGRSDKHANPEFPDCNGNGLNDEDEMANNPELDCNGDGIPDDCGIPFQCTQTERRKLVVEDPTGINRISAVAIDGDVLAIGVGEHDCNDGSRTCGEVIVFRKNGTEWKQEASLVATTGSISALYGRSLAIDDNTIVVGAPGTDFNTGAGFGSGTAYVFEFNGLEWVEIAAFTQDQPRAFDAFASSVDIDGDTMVIAAPGEACSSGEPGVCGAVYVYKRHGSSFTLLTKIHFDDGLNFTAGGHPVAVSGNVIVATVQGGEFPLGPNAVGKVHVFRLHGNKAELEDILDDNTGAARNWFGLSIDVRGDTLMVAVTGFSISGRSAAPAGGAVFYLRTRSGWKKQTEILPPLSPNLERGFGASVVLGDGVAVIGSSSGQCLGDRTCGAVKSYHWDGMNWRETSIFKASGASETLTFGRSAAIDDHTLVVSDPQFAIGTAFVFDVRPADTDCNCNGIADTCELNDGFCCEDDENRNGALDSCEIFVAIDIKPGSCRNRFNPKSHGSLSIAILGTEDFDATSIDPSTLTLARVDAVGGAVPLDLESLRGRARIIDMTFPGSTEPQSCQGSRPDGYDDFVVGFDVSVLADVLLLESEIETLPIELSLTGRLRNGTFFTGVDTIEIVHGRR